MIFSDQVESLTGLTISASGTNPTNDQLTQYLKDGVIDVTAKWLVGHPQDAEDFQIASSEVTSNDSYSPKGTIVSVVRESGTNNDWRPCRKTSTTLQAQVLDTESLSFASKYHPAYMVGDNGKISVFPVAGSNPDAFKVYYINNDPKNNTDNAELVHSMSDIRFFPTDKVYLVMLYASIQSLMAAMSGKTSNLPSDIVLPSLPVPPSLETITALTITAVVPPAPVLSVQTISAGGVFGSSTVPTYTKPTLAQAVVPTISDLSVSAVPPSLPSLDTSLPTYSNSDVLGEITQMLTYIETNQDVELANAKASEVQLRLRRQLEDFNSEVQIYQTENAGEVQRYSAEITSYQAEVNTEVQEYMQNLSGDIQVWQAERQTDLNKYTADIQNELNEFNKENVSYQSNLQEAMQELQLSDANEARKVQKYQAEVATYQAEVVTQVQEQTVEFQRIQEINQSSLGKFGAEMQKYTSDSQQELANFAAKMQKQTTDYQWLQGRYVALLNQYNTAFNIPQPQQQQERRR